MKSTFLAAFALIAAAAFAQASPNDVIKDIESVQSHAIADEQAGKSYDPVAVRAEMKAKAEAAIKGIDWAKIDPKDSFAWAQVCSFAQEHKEVCDLTHKYLAANPDAADKFQVQMLMMSSCSALGEADMLEDTLKTVRPTGEEQSVQLAEETVYDFADTIVKGKGPKEGVKVLDQVSGALTLSDPAVEAKTHLDDAKKRLAASGGKPLTDDELLQRLTTQFEAENDSIKMSFVDKKSELLTKQGDRPAAVKAIDDFQKSLNPKSPIIQTVQMLRNRTTLPGSPAPQLAVEKSYGTFTNLSDLKGKVVIVDTFAHWCGPCKASFPAMRSMYDDLKGKGLEIVGVTTFYGSYGNEQNLTPDQEYAKMADFRTEHKMNWPIVFGPRTNFEHYGVSGIPTTYLIDRSGKVRDIHVGYSPEEFSAFRKEVEGLLAEK